jgi:hypothetical protein
MSSKIGRGAGHFILLWRVEMKQAQAYDQWLLPDDESTKLPSGMPCILRFPPSEYFLRIGSLPGGRVATAIAQGTDVETLTAESKAGMKADWEANNCGDSEFDFNEIRDNELRANLLICYVFVEPKFSMEPKDGEIHPRRLRSDDRTFIIEWYGNQVNNIARGGRADVESFRPEPESGSVADERGDTVQALTG